MNHYQTNMHYFNAGTYIKNNDNIGNALQHTFFIKTIESNPEDYYTWLRVGEWLFQLNEDHLNSYLLGISCLKKAYDLKPEAKQESYSYSLDNEKKWEKHPTANIDMLKAYKIDFRIEYLIIQYQNIFSDGNKNLRERIKLIKEIAETKDSIFFNFLQYIIITEIEFDIRIAALKRIHYFKNKIDLKSFFEDLINHKKRTINEPFFSISLYYINESWATDLIDKKIITEISTENEVWDSNSTESLDNETEDLFFKISYFKK